MQGTWCAALKIVIAACMTGMAWPGGMRRRGASSLARGASTLCTLESHTGEHSCATRTIFKMYTLYTRGISQKSQHSRTRRANTLDFGRNAVSGYPTGICGTCAFPARIAACPGPSASVILASVTIFKPGMGYDAEEFKEVVINDNFAGPDGKPHNNPEVECKHCNHTFRGGAYRIRGHLLGIARGVSACPSVPDTVKQKFENLEGANKAKKDAVQKRKELDQRTSSGAASASARTADSATATEDHRLPPIQRAFNRVLKADVDAALTDYMFAEGVPLMKVESPFFRELVAQVARHGPGYKLPDRRALSTTMLDAAVQRVEKDLRLHPQQEAQQAGRRQGEAAGVRLQQPAPAQESAGDRLRGAVLELGGGGGGGKRGRGGSSRGRGGFLSIITV